MVQLLHLLRLARQPPEQQVHRPRVRPQPHYPVEQLVLQDLQWRELVLLALVWLALTHRYWQARDLIRQQQELKVDRFERQLILLL